MPTPSSTRSREETWPPIAGYSSLVVADRILELAKAGRPMNALSPMQLLKLVYIAHGWMLALYSRPLICDEIEAWRYGPVIPELYHEIKRFGSRPVVGPLNKSPTSIDKAADDIVRQVYDGYGHYTAAQLSELTHQSGTPWATTRAAGYGWRDTISNSLIEEYYRRKSEPTGG